MNRRNVLRTAAAAAAGATGALAGHGALAAPVPTKKKDGPQGRDVSFRRWADQAAFSGGTVEGAEVTASGVTFVTAAGSTSHTDPVTGVATSYETASWTGPMVTTDFPATELIASWRAQTPGGSFVRIEVSGVTEAGASTKWYNLGNWAADDSTLNRGSVKLQGDDHGFVAVDTFVARDGQSLTAWRLRVTLLRPSGSTDQPSLTFLGAMASRLPEPGKWAASVPQAAQGIVLDVPQYSQSIHLGEYPQWDGGGQAWCSPTSTSMVLSYWGTGPQPEDYAWVDPAYADPWVDYAARHTYDHVYVGCGNWPFNTAYAGRFGLTGFVTRLRSLNEAERFIAAGIPLVASASFKKGQIPGLSYGTNGHLMVLVGFTASGDPVLNDPNSPTNAQVRKPVGRAEWEAAWLNTSGGIVYVIHPDTTALPAAPDQANW